MTIENKLTYGFAFFALTWIVIIFLLFNNAKKENEQLRIEIAETEAKIIEIEEITKKWRDRRKRQKMKPQEFELVTKGIFDACKDALGLKGDEYGKGGDRLYNFYRAAEKRAKHPLDILLGFQVKHRVSIDDICSDIMKEEKYPTDELLMEKIKDDINYNILCYALIVELRKKAREVAQKESHERNILHNTVFFNGVKLRPYPEETNQRCTGCYFSGDSCAPFRSAVAPEKFQRVCEDVIWKKVL